MRTPSANNPYIDLLKYRISIAVAISAAVGWFVYDTTFSMHLPAMLFGVFFLASAASALNMIQERHLDARMKRTENRPLPLHLIQVKSAGMFVILLIIIGTLFLLYSGTIPALLGLLTIVIYNFIYTPLKTVTSYSVLPGSLVGAIPPMIGWAANGGEIFSVKIALLSMLMFIWQVPHFWLLAIKYKDQYEKAGFATITKILNTDQIKRLIFIWTTLTSAIVCMFPVFGVINHLPLIITLLILNAFLIVSFYRLSFEGKYKLTISKAFLQINLYLMLIFVVLIGDSIL